MPCLRLSFILLGFFALSACGTQINTLTRIGQTLSGDTAVGPPGMTSLTITDASPTNHHPIALNWGLEVGTHTDYCLLENSTDVNLCVWQSGSLPTTYNDSASDGAFSMTAYLKNVAGVSTAVSSNSVTIDRTAPVLASAAVTNSNPTTNATFSLSMGAVTVSTYSKYCIGENNSAVGSCSWVTGTLPATKLMTGGDGAKVLTVWVMDDAGNVSAPVSTASVTLDTTAPVVAITSPAANSVMNETAWASYAVSGTCTENGANVAITGDAAATPVCTAGAWTANLDFSAAANGTVSISVGQTDAAGNVATPATRSFSKVPTPGAFAIASAVPGNQKVTLTWGASTGATTYTVKYGTVSGTYGTTFSTTATSPLDVTGLTNGTTYYFMVTAVNAGGSRDATAEASAKPDLLMATTAGPATLATGICSSSAYTVTSRDAGGSAVNVAADVTVTLVGGTGMTFYPSTDTTCSGAAITALTITTGTSAKSFYAKTNLAGTGNVGGTAATYTSSPLSVTTSWAPTRVDLVAGTTIGAGTTDDPTGTNARFNAPHGVAIDTANNVLYVADTYNCTVRRVDLASGGATTTIAGTAGQCGIVDGNGAAARFQLMYGITYDGARYLYATDRTNCAIRKIDTQSPYAVTTVLGSAGCGLGSGTEAQTKLSKPFGIVYSPTSDSGTGPFLYVASYSKNVIIRIDLGVATTNAGYGTVWVGSTSGTAGTTDATGTSARLGGPSGLATDGTNLYVTELDNYSISKIVLSTAAKATISTSVDHATGVAVVGTNLYYTNSPFMGGGEIQRMTTAGASQTSIAGQSAASCVFCYGDADAAIGTNAWFSFRNLGFSYAADASFVYVPDAYNNSVRKIGITAPYPVTTVAGAANKGGASTDSATGVSARFKQISATATDGTSVFLSEKMDGSTVRKYSIATGAVTTLAGSATTTCCTDGAAGTARFTRLRSLAYRSGTVYAFDEGCGLRTIDASTGAVGTMTLSGTDPTLPGAYAMAAYGNYLYLASFTNYWIWRIDLTAASPQAVVRVAGTGSTSDSTGPAGTTSVGRPSAIWVNATDIYYFDSWYTRIKRIDYAATNSISVFAGAGSSNTMADGTGATISMVSQYAFGGLTGDSTYLYFLDSDGGVLRRINLSTGASSMMIGDATASYYGNWSEQRQLDGVYSTSSAANMAQGTHSLTLTNHGLFMSTAFGTQWVH